MNCAWINKDDLYIINALCRSKPNLPNQTDSNAALLPHLTRHLGSPHEWSGVWNGPTCQDLELGGRASPFYMYTV